MVDGLEGWPCSKTCGVMWGCFSRTYKLREKAILIGTFLLQNRVFTGCVPINHSKKFILIGTHPLKILIFASRVPINRVKNTFL